MISFSRSTFTWKTYPWQQHPTYRYDGGFVGQSGQVYQVRFNLDAKCEIRDETTGRCTDVFLGAPCRAEYTIAERNLFQIPSSEWRMAFSRECRLTLAKRPSWEEEPCTTSKLCDVWQDHQLDIREFADAVELTHARSVIEATLANAVLSARSTYKDPATGLVVTVEYPVHVMNLNTDDCEFQVCTGPVVLPDLRTWDGNEVGRVFQAHAAFSRFDWVEFILRREVEAAEHEKQWLDAVRGRDRFELNDPEQPPPGCAPARPNPTVYSEVWEFEATNLLLRAP